MAIFCYDETMQFTTVSIIGLTAEALIIISQLPQIIKSYRSRSTEDLSLATIILVLMGLLMWLVYGLLKPDMVIVITNCFSLLMFGVVLIAKVKFSEAK